LPFYTGLYGLTLLRKTPAVLGEANAASIAVPSDTTWLIGPALGVRVAARWLDPQSRAKYRFRQKIQ
jgi:hypothetical protein